MRDTNDTSFVKGVARVGMKALPLAIILAGLTPLQALAAGEEVCNTDVHVTGVLGPTPYFVGDELILEAFIAADLIKDNARAGGPDGENPYIDFTGIGYGVDCGGGKDEDSQGCFPTGYPDGPLPWGHDIEFLGVTGSDCTHHEGGQTNWPIPEADNIVSVPALNPPVRLEYDPVTGEGVGCNVDMKFRVNALHESSNWVVQAVGVPYYAGEGEEDDMVGQCSNGLSATSYGKTVFAVNTCDISVNKQVSLDGETWSDAAAGFNGDDVYYRVVLTNTGTAPLIGSVIVNDPMLSIADVPVDADGLNPEEALVIDGGLIENFNYTASCEVESTVVNTAGVEAWCRGSDGSEFEVSASMEDTASLTCAPLPPRIDLVKTADPLIYSYVEETIIYSFLVTNSGSVALSDVKVEDPLPGLSTIKCPQDQDTLAVGEAMTCTASYLITQDDLDAKSVANTATAYGTSPDNKTVSAQDSANITTTPKYALALVKTADPLFYEAAGEDIAYAYQLTNSGNQTLYPPYAVVDDKTTVTCPQVPASLAPSASITCAATYKTTVDDVNDRFVTNVAMGSAMNAASGGSKVDSNQDEETVVYKGIELSASAFCVNDVPWASYDFEVFGIQGYQPGDVTYEWVNVIDTPGTDIVVKAGAFTATKGYLLWPGAVASGGPGANPPVNAEDPLWPTGIAWPGWTESPAGVWTFVDVPEVPELVLRVSINPTDEEIVYYPPATPDCVAGPEAVINVDKEVVSVTPVSGGSVDVAYKVTVSNTGGQKGTYDLVDTLMVDEAFTPASVQSQVAYVAGTENDTNGDIKTPDAVDFVSGATLVEDEDLDVGMNESFTVTLRFSVNEPLVSAEGSNCNPEDDEGTNTGFTNHVDVYVNDEKVDEAEDCDVYPLTPSIEVLKEILDGDAWVPADDENSAPVVKWPSGAVYRIKVTNTGIVDLVNVVLNDPKLGLDDYVVNGGVLAAGASVTIDENTDQLTAVLAQEEVCSESESFQNTATVNAEGSIEGIPVTDSDDAWLRCVGTPDIEVKKYISIDDGVTWVDGTSDPVQVPSGALYKITVENIGQTDLVDVEVDDSEVPNGPYLVGDLAIGEMFTITDGVVDDTGDGAWSDLNIGSVCSTSGLYQNIADAIGTSAEYDEDTTDTDDAFLDCIGPPMISILKEVSLNGGQDWHDANEAPFPTAVVDDTAETGLYRITVGNIGSVALFNVLVNDTTLGITDYLVGSLNPGETVELDSGDIAALSVENICSSTGEKANIATAKGTSAAGNSDEMSDSATIDCIGKPAIRILKEVSANGVVWNETEVTALAPSDAYYRITVSNIGNVDLVNVTVSDSVLGITDFVPVGAGGAGTLAIGETVVIAHTGGGDNELTDLHVVGLCEDEETIPNTATADGKSADSTETVHAEDDATFICEVPVDICDESGRPLVLKMQYEGVSIDSHSQGASGVIVPVIVDLPAVATLKLYDKNELEDTVVKAIGDSFNILGDWTPSGKIPPNITIEIFDGTTLKQTITFHGSCSAPLIVGDQFGGVKITGYTAF